MFILKRKQIVVVSLVLMVVIAGYLNWSYRQNNGSVNDSVASKNLGESKLVDNTNKDIVVPKTSPASGAVTSVQATSKPASGAATSVQATAKPANATAEEAQFFTDAKKSKADARSESIALLESMIGNPNSDADAKQKAQTQMLQITKNNDVEMVTENLIKAKGFKNVVVFLHDNIASVTVQAPTKLNQQQVVQIQNIVMTEAKIATDKIKIIEVK